MMIQPTQEQLELRKKMDNAKTKEEMQKAKEEYVSYLLKRREELKDLYKWFC